jgi:hypothetical protein
VGGDGTNARGTDVTLRDVTVEKRKWDGQVSGRWRALLVDGRPDRWVWFIPAGTCHERPWRDRESPTDADQVVVGTDEPWLLTVALDGEGHPVSAEADAILPVRAEGDGVVSFVDLDIDLELDLGTGGTSLKDEEQFRERCVQMGYPLGVQRTAWRGLWTLRERFRSGRWPFGPDLAAIVTEARAVAGDRGTRPEPC